MSGHHGQAAGTAARMTSTSSSRVGPGAKAGRQPSWWTARASGSAGLSVWGSAVIPNASGVLANPGVGFDHGGDEVDGERDAQVIRQYSPPPPPPPPPPKNAR